MGNIKLICKKCGYEWELKKKEYRQITCRKCLNTSYKYDSLIKKFRIIINGREINNKEDLKNHIILKEEIIEQKLKGEEYKEEKEENVKTLKTERETIKTKVKEEFGEEFTIPGDAEKDVLIRRRVRLSPRLLILYMYYKYKTGEDISFDYFLNKMILEACDKLYGIRVAIIDKSIRKV